MIISIPLLDLNVSRLAYSKMMISLGQLSFSKYDVGISGLMAYKVIFSSSEELPTSSEDELFTSSSESEGAIYTSSFSSFCLFLECFYLVSIYFQFNFNLIN